MGDLLVMGFTSIKALGGFWLAVFMIGDRDTPWTTKFSRQYIAGRCAVIILL